jgi:hypothetical protein
VPKCVFAAIIKGYDRITWLWLAIGAVVIEPFIYDITVFIPPCTVDDQNEIRSFIIPSIVSGPFLAGVIGDVHMVYLILFARLAYLIWIY